MSPVELPMAAAELFVTPARMPSRSAPSSGRGEGDDCCAPVGFGYTAEGCQDDCCAA